MMRPTLNLLKKNFKIESGKLHFNKTPGEFYIEFKYQNKIMKGKWKKKYQIKINIKVVDIIRKNWWQLQKTSLQYLNCFRL